MIIIKADDGFEDSDNCRSNRSNSNNINNSNNDDIDITRIPQ